MYFRQVGAGLSTKGQTKQGSRELAFRQTWANVLILSSNSLCTSTTSRRRAYFTACHSTCSENEFKEMKERNGWKGRKAIVSLRLANSSRLLKGYFVSLWKEIVLFDALLYTPVRSHYSMTQPGVIYLSLPSGEESSNKEGRKWISQRPRLIKRAAKNNSFEGKNIRCPFCLLYQLFVIRLKVKMIDRFYLRQNVVRNIFR